MGDSIFIDLEQLLKKCDSTYITHSISFYCTLNASANVIKKLLVVVLMFVTTLEIDALHIKLMLYAFKIGIIL
jgi:hypothetical protein